MQQPYQQPSQQYMPPQQGMPMYDPNAQHYQQQPPYQQQQPMYGSQGTGMQQGMMNQPMQYGSHQPSSPFQPQQQGYLPPSTTGYSNLPSSTPPPQMGSHQMTGYQQQPPMMGSSSGNIPQVIWVWQVNDTTFAPFSAMDCQRLEDSSRRGEQMCVVDINGRQHSVDLMSLSLSDANTSKDDKKNKRFVCRVDLSFLMTGRPVDMASAIVNNPIKRKKEKKGKKDKKK